MTTLIPIDLTSITSSAGAAKVSGDLPDNAGIRVTVTRSSGDDGAVLVMIDTTFEPNGNDGGPGLRILINDANVTECDDDDFVALGTSYDRVAEGYVLSANVEDLGYKGEDSDTEAMYEALGKVHKAAEGDSNDGEIEAYRAALELALTKWNIEL
jgi:hypothetical protein